MVRWLSVCLGIGIACAPQDVRQPTVVTVAAQKEQPGNRASVTVTLVSHRQEQKLVPPITVSLEPAGMSSVWLGMGAVELDNVPPGVHTIRTRGALSEPLSVELRAGSRANLRLRALSVEQFPALATPAGERFEKLFVIDTTLPDRFELSWREGWTVVAEASTERTAEALRRRASEEWTAHGSHRGPDPESDQAVLLVNDGLPLSEATVWIEALASVKRSYGPDAPDPEGRPNHDAFRIRLASAESALVQKPKPDPKTLPAPPASATATLGTITVSGRIPPEQVRSAIERQRERVLRCYGVGLRKHAGLAGKVAVSLLVGVNGAIARVQDNGSEVSDRETVECVLKAFHWVELPRPAGGIVIVNAPIVLEPG